MAGLVRMSLDSPEEVRPFEDGRGQVELVNLEGGAVGRGTFEPGWQWSKHVKPIAGTESCQASHMGYVISGRMKIVMDDGQEDEFGPGDFMICPPGHDAWVLGDEAFVAIDWQGFADYAKRS
ncbi:cupin domain-containing protein [Kitasatospora sp. DSM 101779]|uniref:cupin domain-containing protein n=1 Tax=Kitasatospora sp. DSM 101779 TaxID=2853165 RepID=UPI0021DB4B95|nr:cupin domain-containing protein [Kitasatospora sp. DSM 101779]MCU7823103.1 cupin domain-containing protein [Kitasatospora sp. DSM 101779]